MGSYFATTTTAALLLISTSAQAPDTRPFPTFNFGTKSPYWFSTRDQPETISVSPEEGDPGSTCKPIMLQHVGRHGSRLTDAEDFDALVEFFQTHRDAISNSSNPEIASFVDWQTPFDPINDSLLTAEGRAEIFAMGQRYKDTFGETFDFADYNPNEHLLSHSWKARAGNTGASFTLSAFQEGNGEVGTGGVKPVAFTVLWNGEEDGFDGDLLLRYSDNCPKYEEIKDDDNSAMNVEAAKHEEILVETIAPKVAAKLGVSAEDIDFDVLDSIFTGCVYANIVAGNDIIDNQASPCILLDDEDVELMAFHDDLAEYYESGYGTEIATQFGCPLISDIVSQLNAKQEGDSIIKTNMRFGHSESIMGVMTLLGLFKDEIPLTAEMTEAQKEARRWKGFIISPMGVNMDFILHECENTAGDLTHKVEMRYNEFQVSWPKCGDNENVPFCTPEEIVAAYPLAGGCDYEAICAVSSVVSSDEPGTDSDNEQFSVASAALVGAVVGGLAVALMVFIGQKLSSKKGDQQSNILEQKHETL